MTEPDPSVEIDCSAALSEIVMAIFQSMLGLEVAPGGPAGVPAGQPRVVARVGFGGRSSGCLTLETGVEQARRFAGRFLRSEAPADDDTVLDIIGELINMICGNLKSTLAPGAVLSMPEVAGAESPESSLEPGARRFTFSSDDGPFWIATSCHPV